MVSFWHAFFSYNPRQLSTTFKDKTLFTHFRFFLTKTEKLISWEGPNNSVGEGAGYTGPKRRVLVQGEIRSYLPKFVVPVWNSFWFWKHYQNKRNKQMTLVSLLSIYLFKVTNRRTKKSCEICSKSTVSSRERGQWGRSGVFIVNFNWVSNLFLVFLFLTLNRVNICWAVTLNGYWDCTVPSSLAVNTTTSFKSDGLKARTFCCTVRTSALFADHSISFSFCLFVNWAQISQALTLSLWGCSVVISVPLWVQTFTWPSDDTEVTHPYYN